MYKQMRLWLPNLFFLLLMAILLSTSVVQYTTPVEKVRRYTGGIEYNYVDWVSQALSQKAGQSQLSLLQHVSAADQAGLVLRYFELIRRLEEVQWRVELIYTDPGVKHPQAVASVLLNEESDLESALTTLAPLAETVLQHQVAEMFQEQGIGFIGESLPPVLFHSSPLPKALIVSPRDKIQEDVNISLLADLSLEDIDALETRLDQELDVSTLVVDVGGIGVYPTMVQRTSNMEWTIDTIAHEWTHNYLTLRPLGMRYDKTPELRTMNETTASIVGTEISRLVMERYYPQSLGSINSRKLAFQPQSAFRPQAALAPVRQDFDFRAEMHLTRVKVDELLSLGQVEEAEHYMEQRRVYFVQNGYMIRKLNQAYFAFYGAYAATPGGAAGEDPVGPAVRKLRADAVSLADFLRRIAHMRSFTDLQKSVQ